MRIILLWPQQGPEYLMQLLSEAGITQSIMKNSFSNNTTKQELSDQVATITFLHKETQLPLLWVDLIYPSKK